MKVRIAIEVANGPYLQTWSSVREITQSHRAASLDRDEYFDALRALCDKAFTKARDGQDFD